MLNATLGWICNPVQVFILFRRGMTMIKNKLQCKAVSIALCCLCCLFFVAQSLAQVSVITYHNNNSRTGLNAQETILTPANVSNHQLGRLFYQSVDANIFAQPLYVPNLAIPGQGTHNVVFVATENDSVYAFDADQKIPVLWHANLIDGAHGGVAGEIPMSPSDITYPGCSPYVLNTIGPVVGTTSTPVIDLTTHRMYVETKSRKPNYPNQPVFVHRLHAIDITTGNDIARVDITAAGFDPLMHLQRAALLLSNGVIFLGFGSHNDCPSWHGWLFAYDAATLSQKAVFDTTPSGSGGSIWMSGNGPAADTGGNIYAATSNGDFDTTLNSQGYPVFGDFGDSLLKFTLSGNNLAVTDYFTTNNESYLNQHDLDVGAGGIILLPDQPGSYPHLLIQVGKDGTIYLLNRDQMTTLNRHYCVNCLMDSQIVQELYTAVGNNNSGGGSQGANFYSSPVYWNGNVYFWGINDVLKMYSLNNGLLSTSPTHSSYDAYGTPPNDMQGANLSISSNGNQNGIVWSLSSQYFWLSGSLVLRAHDATNLSLLYSSDSLSSDDAGPAVKFAVPTVANGKVYVGAGGQFTVYGLL